MKSSTDSPFSVIVEGKVIYCDRHTLMKESEYFRAMFDSCMVESQRNEVTLHDLKFDIVSILVDYMTTGELRICQDTVEELTQTAVLLMIDGAITSCVAYYTQHLDNSTCLHIMSLSARLNFYTLYNQARRHALYYFDKVIKEAEFVNLEPDVVKDYLSDPHLNCSSEVQILDAVLLWYKHEMEDRRQSVTSLLEQCFHVEDITGSEWTIMLEHDVIKQFTQPGQYQQYADKNRETPESKKYREVPHMILSIGGKNKEGKFCTDVYRFDEDEKILKPYLNLNNIYPKTSTKMGFQVTVIGKDLYLSGGQESMSGSSWILDVWKLDGFTLKWEKVTRLPSPRRHHGACASDDSLFIMGGFGKYRDILTTVQQYHTINDSWLDLPEMPIRCFTPTAVFCENKLFVYKTMTACLHMDTRQWTIIREVQNSVCPLYHRHYIYEIPLFPPDSEWFEQHDYLPKMKVSRTDITSGECELVPFNEDIKLGNPSTVFNGKFYTFGFNTDTLICGSLDNLLTTRIVGSGSKSGNHCFIVVMPHYPQYKIKS